MVTGVGKTVVFAGLGFVVPVYIALHASPSMFRFASPPPGYARASLAAAVSTSESASNEERLLPEPQSEAIRVPSDQSLDPVPSRYFVVSIDVKINSLPRLHKRQRLVSKYSTANKPYPGWGLAIRRLQTSTRPEIYWQNGEGKGGWYTFDHVRFDRNRWYTLTIVARDTDLLSLYIEPREPKPGDPSASDELDEMEDGVRFLGGYNLAGMTAQQTPAALEFTPPVTENGEFRGQVRNVLVARPERLPPRQEKLREMLEGGTEAFVSRLEPEDLSLWIDESGADRSPAQRSPVERGVAPTAPNA